MASGNAGEGAGSNTDKKIKSGHVHRPLVFATSQPWGAADFDVLEGPVRIRPLRPTRTGKGRERGHSPLPIQGATLRARSTQCATKNMQANWIGLFAPIDRFHTERALTSLGVPGH